MYHPYCHSPSALTEYLKAKLCTQRAKRLSHSLSAQVEQSVPLKHNTHMLTRGLLRLFGLGGIIWGISVVGVVIGVYRWGMRPLGRGLR